MLKTKRFRSPNTHLNHLTCNVLFFASFKSCGSRYIHNFRHVCAFIYMVCDVTFFSCAEVPSLAYLSTDIARYGGCTIRVASDVKLMLCSAEKRLVSPNASERFSEIFSMFECSWLICQICLIKLSR